MGSAQLRDARLIRRELSAAAHIPYALHVGAEVVKTHNGDYVQALQLAGASFESADDSQINAWHERLNLLWRNLASPNVALWAHVVRRRENAYPEGELPPGFARELDARYRARLAGETLMVNDLYLSLLWRPQPTRSGSALLAFLRRTEAHGEEVALRDALDACAKLRDQVLAALARYEPRPLGIYRHGAGHFSSLLEFFGLLVNGEWQRLPVPRAAVSAMLATSRPLFGHEAIEYRMATRTRVGAMLGIKEYPTPTLPGIFNALLSARFACVLSQSFSFLAKATAQSLLARQFNRMHNAGDLAVSQADALEEALDDLSSNRFVMGDHHLTLQVLAEPVEAGDEAALRPRLRELNEAIAQARSLLADTGMVVVREDRAAEAAFWAQLPGNFAYRSRKAPITSRNFAAMMPLHNYPAGRKSGNHWGEALTLLATSAASPYYFSLHAADPNDPEGGARKDCGHTFVCGPTGTGKTVFIGFCVAMARKLGATQVIFDKDQGLKLLVLALGGQYLPFQHGVPTGCNPLALDPTPGNVEFLKRFLRRLVQRPGRALSVAQEADLDHALRTTLGLAPGRRRLSRLIEALDPTEAEGVHARLAPWCEVTGGDYAWLFDNPADRIVPLLDTAATLGFDVTEFLDSDVTREPIAMYLFHLTERMVDGRRLICWQDEFWRLIGQPAFEAFARNGPKTWRKNNAVMAMATQSPADVLDSTLARTVVEQTATKVFFPNPDASRADYVEGFGLTEREFALIRDELEPGERSFLVKQGHHSVVCRLDLKGFDLELAVISGRRNNLATADRLIAEFGPDPAAWLGRFDALRSHA
jgi:type IV secretion system protein VirB4